MDRRVYLIGMPGSGKSTVGVALAECLGREFVDLDEEIELEAGRSIPEIFRENGETRFRELESAALGRVATRERVVVACGGGTPLDEGNQRLMHETGTVILLKPSLRSLRSRLGELVKGRPLVRGPVDLDRMYKERDATYRRVAHLEFRADGDPHELAKTIAEALS